MQQAPLISTVTPAALVMSKTIEPQHTVTLQNQTATLQQLLPSVRILNYNNCNKKST